MNGMRLTVSALALLGLLHNAQAADYSEPILRGSDVFAPAQATYFNWGGFYVGGQGGYSHAEVGFGTGASTLLDGLFEIGRPGNPRIAVPMSADMKDSIGASSYGGFVGYNAQFENVIVGVEANYNRTSLDALSSETVPLLLPDIGTASASSTAHLTDYGTVRARMGYIMGRFMPYAMLGLAIGRADFTDSARLEYLPFDNGALLPAVDFSGTASQSGTIVYGWAAGLGVDVMLTSGLFLRGEYEFVQFTSSGSSPIVVGSSELRDHTLNLNTFRGAVGFKF